MGRKATARRIAATVHRYVNNKRVEQGLSELAGNADLAQTAENYAREMAQQDRIGHHLDGSTPQTRASKFVGVSENCLKARHAHRQAGDLANEAVERWMHSAGHRENITRAESSHSGVGVWISNNNVFIVQMFAYRRGVAQLATELVP